MSANPTVTVGMSASPSTVTSGSSSTLTWTSNNATACTASGGWSGSKAISGSQSSGALTASTNYSLTCTGAGGGSATQSATISVTAPAPTVSLGASSQHGYQRRQLDRDLVRHQCDLLHRLRRLVGDQGHQRLAIHRSPDRQLNLRTYLHRYRRQRDAIRDGLGNIARTDDHLYGEPQHGRQRQ